MNQNLVTFLLDVVPIDQPGGMIACLNKANGHDLAAIHIGLGVVPVQTSKLVGNGRPLMMQVNMVYAVATKEVYEKIKGVPYDRQAVEHMQIEGSTVQSIMGRKG